jgi:UDP-N-acetylglucosamine 2-epimerase (non-hydrolysing)
MKILHVVGARPNLVKLAPVYRALRGSAEQLIVHTGQHYDYCMSGVFFEQLRLPAPDFNLQVRAGEYEDQISEIMLRFEAVALAQRPDLVIVYGDVNSTLAAALTCSKLSIKLAHVEAGLRSFDMSMPEERNRIITDQLSDLLFTPSEDANRNLLNEGLPAQKIHFVGNVMIDTLVELLPESKYHIPPNLLDRFLLLTLHRPANVGDLPWLAETLAVLNDFGPEVPVVFPVHPRTRESVSGAGLNRSYRNVRMLEPLPYLSFLALQRRATVVITDSGGIQEESTFLGTPCITIRENTERPVTIEVGTNVLVGRSPGRLRSAIEDALCGRIRNGKIPPLWDGRASERIAEAVLGSWVHTDISTVRGSER